MCVVYNVHERNGKDEVMRTYASRMTYIREDKISVIITNTIINITHKGNEVLMGQSWGKTLLRR